METRTLVLVEDDELADEVLRVAAAAGCEVDRVWDIAEARRRWAAAPLVLVGADTLPRLPEAGLGRRRGVLAVSTSPLPEGNWRAAVLLGVDRVVTLPGDDELLVTALADATEPPATRAAPVIGVLGGRGGAGASTFAASVAWASARRGGHPLLVARELPPAVVACLWRLTLCVLVVPAEVRACAAAGALVRRLTHHGCEPRLVVRGPAPGGLTARDVSTAVGVPVLTTMRPEPGLAGRLDRGAFRGRPRGPLATAAERVLGAAGPSAAQGSAA
ncbi:hypothetical protein [Actinoalloteichus caeruleus]|uniref:hypothetical protein n=1 Tax=Actinoalloteichus cyanogriseus TaxID=2893586 RepID=UPI00069025F7|nr:hypothetical protein [Actinoalloteichus caeruleus]